MALPDSFITELLARNDIVDVVGEYVRLTKKSGSNMFGLCPFHNEKTPSFSVSPDKQIYHCFGCGKGGGVINFIMEYEGLTYYEAVEVLARRAGLEIPEAGNNTGASEKRKRIYEINLCAARFFNDYLQNHYDSPCGAYLEKRAIPVKLSRKFGLGYAPDDWRVLEEHLRKAGFTYSEMVSSGLCKQSKNGKGLYDTFRNRLMFPIFDLKGNVIGFSGRALGDNEPKYLNSPDTPVFNKSKNLFALNFAKKSKLGYVILAEGNIDVVSLYKFGFDCAVASLGTSLTSDQCKLISRFTDNVLIAYDADEAGKKATMRAIPMLEAAGLNIKVLTINNAKDPDEYLNKYGADAFRNLIEDGTDRNDFRLEEIKAKYDISTDAGRLDYINDATTFIAGIPNAIERDLYCGRLSKEFSVAKDAVQLEVNKKIKRKLREKKKADEHMATRPVQNFQPTERTMKYTNAVSAASEEGVIRLLILDPSLIQYTEMLTADDFTSDFLRNIFSKLTEMLSNGENPSPALLAASLLPQESDRLTLILQKPEDLSEGKKAITDYIANIKSEGLRFNAKNAENDAMALAAMMDIYKNKKGYGSEDER